MRKPLASATLFVLLGISFATQAQTFGFPSDPATAGIIILNMQPGKQSKVKGDCLDKATAATYRNGWGDNRDQYVRENLARKIPNIENIDIIDAKMKNGFTCWYVEAIIRRR